MAWYDRPDLAALSRGLPWTDHGCGNCGHTHNVRPKVVENHCDVCPCREYVKP